MQTFRPLAIKEALNPFSFFETDRENKLDIYSLPFDGTVGKGKKQRDSFWMVKPTGNYGDDLRLGKSYAFEALRVARANQTPYTLQLIMNSFPGRKKMAELRMASSR